MNDNNKMHLNKLKEDSHLYRLSWIKVKNNKILDCSGNEKIFRGLAFPDPIKLTNDNKWNEEYFKKAKEWNANIVRIPIIPENWRKVKADNYLKILDQGAFWAKKYNMYIILDWHSIGNVIEGVFDRNEEYDYSTTVEETKEFWRIIAGRYKNEPAIAFYEIFNEPSAMSHIGGKLTWNQWKKVAENIINEISKQNSKAVPLVGGMDWSYFLNEVVDNPIDIPGIGYVSHPYPEKNPKEKWEERWHKDFGFVKEKYPVFATELGYMQWKDGNSPARADREYAERVISYFEKQSISWAVWCFDPEWKPSLIKDWDFTLTESGAAFKDKMRRNIR